MTSGTDSAHNLEWKKRPGCVVFTWIPPKVYGSNKLYNQIFCYHELGLDVSDAVRITLAAGDSTFRANTLRAGCKYKVWIEAAIYVRLYVDSTETADSYVNDSLYLMHDDMDKDKVIDHHRQLRDHRLTLILSESLLMRIPAPCEPVIVNTTGYTSETIDIYWARPNLYSHQPNPDGSNQDLHIYRHLIGYRLEVNGIKHRTLEAHETTCTLVKCKGLHVYNIVIIALTCLQNAVESHDPLANNEVDINEIDESPSLPLQLRTFSTSNHYEPRMLKANFENVNVDIERYSLGRIRVDWELVDHKEIDHFNVNWFSSNESLALRKTCEPNVRTCYISITKSRSIYEINLEVVYKTGRKTMISENLHIEVAGSPEPPVLWLEEQINNIIKVHWSECRIYPYVDLSGYQLYLNDVKVGEIIDKNVTRATIPLKPNR
jgi:hypothetical protein